MELTGFEARDELQVITVTQQATPQYQQRPKPICHHCKKPSHHRNWCRQLKREKDEAQGNANSAGNNCNNNGGQKNSNSNNKNPINTNANNTKIQKDRKPRLVYPTCETCGKTNQPTEKGYFGANAADRLAPRNRRLEGQNQVQQRNAQNSSYGNVQAAAQTLN